MPTTVNIGATSYQVATQGERSWGVSTTNLLVRLAAVADQVVTSEYILTGNFFPRDSSGNYGIKGNFLQGIGSTASADGFIRMASPHGEPGQGASYPVGTPEGKSYTYVSWRNSTNTGNLHLYPNSDNTTLSFAGKNQVNVDAVQTLSNKNIDSTNTVAGAAIVDASLNNAKIAADAAIALSKLAGVTASRALVSDGSGVISASAVTATELGYLSGVTGALVGTTSTQTLTNKTIVAASNTVTTAASGNLAATELNAALSELQTDIDTRATSAALTTHEADTSTHGVGEIVGRTETQTLTNKTLTSPTLTNAAVDGYLDIDEESAPGTPAANTVRIYAKADAKIYKKDDAGVETQLATTAEAFSNPMTTSGDIVYGGGSGAATRLAANSTATKKWLRSVSSGTPTWEEVDTVKGSTGTSAIATGYVGEMLGTLRSGTNGFTYSTRSTTAISNSGYVSVVNITLNKGVYLVSGKVSCFTSAGSGSVYAYIDVGGTAVTEATHGYISTTNTGSATQCAPIQITADSTIVRLYARVDAAATASGPNNELFVVRIA
jgi:hypothetical protein